MTPILSLSSCWLSHRHQDGYAMIQEMAALGFTHVELSHGIRITLVPGILKAFEEKMIKVSTCHNFCPLPAGVMHAAPNIFQPSATDSREQEQWVRNTKRSLDFASQLGAKVLICHLGSIGFFWFNPTRKLRHYMKLHQKASYADDPTFEKMKTTALQKLRKRMPRYMDAMKASLSQVLEYAKEKGIVLGFENRERMDELPLDADFSDLFASLPPDSPVGYWHDTGHANIKERMRLINHQEHLKTHAERLLGFHLHDVSDKGQDHQEVGSGRIDFNMVSSFWRPSHILVLELSPRLGVEEVRASKKRIEALIKPLF